MARLHYPAIPVLLAETFHERQGTLHQTLVLYTQPWTALSSSEMGDAPRISCSLTASPLCLPQCTLSSCSLPTQTCNPVFSCEGPSSRGLSTLLQHLRLYSPPGTTLKTNGMAETSLKGEHCSPSGTALGASGMRETSLGRSQHSLWSRRLSPLPAFTCP